MPVATPDQYNAMLDAAKAGSYAYPAINITSSETLNAALRGFAEAGSDGIIQISEDSLNRLYRLYFRVLSDLATVAERAEKLAGFSELPIPAEECD